MVSKTKNDEALETLERCISDLHKEAVAVVDAHWKQIVSAEKQAKSWEDKSQLQLACHRKGNHIQTKWIGIKWYGTKAARKTTKINIPRAAGDLTYSVAKLKEWTRPWELEIVLETEKQLASLRRQAHFIVRAIMAVRNANRIAQNMPPEDEARPAED